MKYIILVLTLYFVPTKIIAQVIDYKVIKIVHNTYDKDMQSFTGWGSWVENTENYNLSFSQNAFKRVDPYFSYRKDDGEWTFTSYTSYTNYVFTFIGNEPNEKYPFRKKVSIKTTTTVSERKNKDDEFVTKTTTVNGTGYVYSTETFEKIMSGYSTGDIYVYYEFENGNKGYTGYNIKTQAMITKEIEREEKLAEEEEEAEERKQLKQKQTNDNIKKIGESLKILLKKN